MRHFRCWGLAAAGLVLAGLTPPAAAPAGGDSPEREDVRIGLVASLFRDVPEPLVMSLCKPFGALMETQTGIAGQLQPGYDALGLGRLLAEDRVELGVFTGIEFAWARKKYPSLQPLMVAVNKDHYLRADLVVRCSDAVNGFADLRGKQLLLPKGSREHCRVFMQKHCLECGQAPDKFFAKIASPGTAEDALDDVVDGEASAALVDETALDCFRRRKPGRCSQLKVALRSEVFPTGVVAYHPGAMRGETLDKFRDGMLEAHRIPLGKQLMTMWRLTGFEPVPDDYLTIVDNIAKYYPPPAPATK